MKKRRTNRRRRGPKTPSTLRKHFLRRAWERAGVDLSLEDAAAIERGIREGDHPRLDKQSHTRSVYAVEHQSCCMAVVYNHNVGAVTTVLPPTSDYHNAARELLQTNG